MKRKLALLVGACIGVSPDTSVSTGTCSAISIRREDDMPEAVAATSLYRQHADFHPNKSMRSTWYLSLWFEVCGHTSCADECLLQMDDPENVNLARYEKACVSKVSISYWWPSKGLPGTTRKYTRDCIVVMERGASIACSWFAFLQNCSKESFLRS